MFQRPDRSSSWTHFVSSPAPDFAFIALDPDEQFAILVTGYKKQMLPLAGPQTFLDHLPHSTIYLAAFTDLAEVASRVRDLAGTCPPAEVSWPVGRCSSKTS